MATQTYNFQNQTVQADPNQSTAVNTGSGVTNNATVLPTPTPPATANSTNPQTVTQPQSQQPQPQAAPQPLTTQPTQQQQPQGLQMPTNGANLSYNPITGNQTVNGSQYQTASQQAVADLQKAFTSVKDQTPPQTAGQGAAVVQNAVNNVSASNTSDPAYTKASAAIASNPTISNAIAQVQQYLTPTFNSQQLQDQLTKIGADQNILAGLNTQEMNLERIMNGTADDIRNEVKAANGFATESQVLALAGARNKTLILQDNLIQNQIKTATQALTNDQNLLNEEKSIAQEQFAQNSTIYNAAQQLYTQQVKAVTDTYNNIIQAVGYQGLYNALVNSGEDPAVAEKALGMQPGQLQGLANQQQAAKNLAIIQASGLTTPYVVTPAGEVWNSMTGQAYTSQEDFQAKTGMTVQQAAQSGKIGNLATVQNLDIQKKLLDLKATQANINQSNASAFASEQAGLKSQQEAQFEKTHGGMTPAEVQTQQTAIDNHVQAINTDAGKQTEALANHKTTWGAAFNYMSNTYPDLQTSDIDKLLHAELYRNPNWGG